MNTKTRPIECCTTPVIPLPLPQSAQTAVVAGFKALGDQSRFEMFRLIAAQREPLCACDIVARFELSQPTISHHLKVLADAGLISVSRRGVWAYYEVAPQGVRMLNLALSEASPMEPAMAR
jgi:ArsR family transcriptional regulator